MSRAAASWPFEGSRAAALAAGARQARSPWLMFLHAGAVLDSGWIEETTQFIQGVANSGRPRAGIFRYARSPYADTRPARRLQIRRADDRRAVGGTGPADRARPLRPARRLRAGRPPLRGAGCCASSAAPRARLLRSRIMVADARIRIYLPKSNNYLTMASIEVRHVPNRIPTARSRRSARSTASIPASSACSTSSCCKARSR